jgi:GAF domain-containing protein/HAMP domain-containing protein
METQKKKPRAARSLTATLSTAFFVLSAAVLSISSGLQIFSNIQTQQNANARLLQLSAKDAAGNVSSDIKAKLNALETAVSLIDPVTTPPEQQTQVLDSLLGLQAAFRQLSMLNAQNQELVHVSRLSMAASGNLAGQLEDDALAQVRQGKSYISPIHIDPLTSEPLVLMAVPATNVFGDFQGTLVAEMNLKYMWDLMDQLKIETTGYAYVVDRQGNLIAFSDTARVLRGENVKEIRRVSEFIHNLASPLMSDMSPDMSTYMGIKGDAVVGTYVPLETPDWAVVTELPWREAYQTIIQIAVVSLLITVAMAVLAGMLGGYAARRLAVPLVDLTETATRISCGEMDLQAAASGPTEVASLAEAFNSMTTQLRQILGDLEKRVAERTLDLERQSAYLQASAEVGRAATSILEIDRLIKQVVELIRERFSLYYVGLFLVDTSGEWAVLRAGTGTAGQAMLARGHRLKIGGGSMIGWSIANAQARVALEAGEDAVRLATAELPETRSEAALPLRSRGQVLGAVTVQSNWPGAFDETVIAVLQAMADQVAVALDNARLFAESQAAVETARRAYGEVSRRDWGELLGTRTHWGYRYANQSVTPAEETWRPDMLEAIQAGEMLESNTGEPALAMPLKVRDHVVGALRFSKGEQGGNWTADEIVLIETLTEQLGVALESARLYQDTQRRAARERLVNEVTARIRNSMTLEAVLNSAVREISHLVEANYAAIDLELDQPEAHDKKVTL